MLKGCASAIQKKQVMSSEWVRDEQLYHVVKPKTTASCVRPNGNFSSLAILTSELLHNYFSFYFTASRKF
jgi:hypothetical protein